MSRPNPPPPLHAAQCVTSARNLPLGLCTKMESSGRLKTKISEGLKDMTSPKIAKQNGNLNQHHDAQLTMLSLPGMRALHALCALRFARRSGAPVPFSEVGTRGCGVLALQLHSQQVFKCVRTARALPFRNSESPPRKQRRFPATACYMQAPGCAENLNTGWMEDLLQQPAMRAPHALALRAPHAPVVHRFRSVAHGYGENGRFPATACYARSRMR